MPWLPDERIPPDCPLCGGTIRVVKRVPADDAAEAQATRPTVSDLYAVRCDDCRNQWQWQATDPYRVTKV